MVDSIIKSGNVSLIETISSTTTETSLIFPLADFICKYEPKDMDRWLSCLFSIFYRIGSNSKLHLIHLRGKILSIVAERGDINKVKFLIEDDPYQKNFLHEINLALLKAVRNRKNEVVKYLFSKGAHFKDMPDLETLLSVFKGYPELKEFMYPGNSPQDALEFLVICLIDNLAKNHDTYST